MAYPKVIDEFYTLNAILSGYSIARFGDGEIKLIIGNNCVSQEHTHEIQKELTHILRTPSDLCLTGIMNLNKPTAKDDFWLKYKEPKRTQYLNDNKIYHSSFITRPDSIPEINNFRYWSDVASIWTDKDVTLVTGGRSSALRSETMPEARSVTEIRGPEKNAYCEIGILEHEILKLPKENVVILCLGPTATCLAWRLAHKGRHALDLGHIAVYYRRFMNGEPLNGKG